MKKIFILFFVLLCIPIYAFADDLNLAPSAGSAILIEASTGEIIYEKNSHEKLAPASMTKMMSMLLIIENIENGTISWDDKVVASKRASDMGGSQILLEENEEMSVSDLFKGIAVASGNDAVVAMAEKIGGTVENFVEMMNKRAKELNLSDTNFKNPHGLDEENHYSSAHDMAMIAKELVKHKKVLEYTSIYEDYLREGTDRKLWLVNTNKLVRFYNGVDGLKTGYTKTAGYCLTATATKNDIRFIAVAMNEPDSKTRNAEITSMLDYGFAQYKSTKLLSKDEIIKEAEVDTGKTKYAKVVPIEDVYVVRKNTEKDGKVTYDVKLNKIKAPVKKGEIVGQIIVKLNNKEYKKIDLTVKEQIKKANVIDLYLRYLKDMLTGDIKF
ncbi:MAG: D-alanyl-D-alanine carboxypeptidase [Bacilli bacterium]|nr:D-alanyl-D-alanine carboxypeptidase [Bacilli bacterium]